MQLQNKKINNNPNVRIKFKKQIKLILLFNLLVFSKIKNFLNQTL